MAKAKVEYETVPIVEIRGEDGERDLLKLSGESGRCVIDTETTGLEWARGDRAFMATFSPHPNIAFATYDIDRLLPLLRGLEDVSKPTFHNAKFDLHILRETVGWELRDPLRFDDTMLALRVLYPNEPAGLKIASKRYVDTLDVDGPEKEVKGWIAANTKRERVGRKYVKTFEPTYADVPKHIMLPYATQDTVLASRTWFGVERDLNARDAAGSTLWTVYARECALIPAFIDMERAGWPIDEAGLDESLALAERMLREAVENFQLLTGTSFNVFSGPALGKYLYDERGFKPHLTDKGNYTVNEEAILDIPDPVLREALLATRRWRQFFNKCNEIKTFCINGRVHGEIRQDTARTGRLSITKPALQNVARHAKEKRWTHVRSLFKAKPGRSLLFVDYSAVEMRLFTHSSGDPILVDIFRTGKDSHTIVTATMYGIKPEDVTKLQRTFGKTMSFTILYGGGVNRIYEALRYGAGGNDPLSYDEAALALLSFEPGATTDNPWKPLAKHLHTAYMEAFPTVKDFTQKASLTVKIRWQKHGRGWVRNPFGRETIVPSEKSYMATNALIQPTAADVMKVALTRVHQVLKPFGDDARMFGTIHDELIFDVKAGMEETVAKTIFPVLIDFDDLVTYKENGVVHRGFRVPLEVEFSVADEHRDWGCKEKQKWEWMHALKAA